MRIAGRPGLVTLPHGLPLAPLALRIAGRPGLVTLATIAGQTRSMLRIAGRPGLVTLALRSRCYPHSCGLLAGRDWLHSNGCTTGRTRCCGLLAGRDWLHSPTHRHEVIQGCGLLAGRDWLHCDGPNASRLGVADCWQAGIGYTVAATLNLRRRLRIAGRPGLVTLYG